MRRGTPERAAARRAGDVGARDDRVRGGRGPRDGRPARDRLRRGADDGPAGARGWARAGRPGRRGPGTAGGRRLCARPARLGPRALTPERRDSHGPGDARRAPSRRLPHR
ncbi:hypothetical protein CYL17_06230 [Thermobispora bispora]|nr:hypothetical protein CYL17_06230 [Thermobispora bispora]